MQKILDVAGFIPVLGDVADAINALIYFARGNMINAMISIGCVVFSVFADSLLKPLKWAAKSVSDAAAKIVGKIPNFAGKIVDTVLWASNKINGLSFIPQGVKTKIAEIAMSFTIRVNAVFAEVTGKTIIKTSDEIVDLNNDLYQMIKNKSSTDIHTGRISARNITEQLFMKEVLLNPLKDAKELFKINDARWIGEGWVKMQRTMNGITIHFNYNKIINIFDDFKFVFPK